MTRETKIGLVVAGSFLCLVCIVVASKWNRGNDASQEPEQQEIKVAAVKPTVNNEKKKDAKKEGTPRLELPAIQPKPEAKGSPAAPEFPTPPALLIPKPGEAPPPKPTPFESKPIVVPPPPGGFEGTKPTVIPMPPVLPAGNSGPAIVPEPTPPLELKFPPLKPTPAVEEKTTPMFPIEDKKPLTIPEPMKPGTLEIPPPVIVPPVVTPKPETPGPLPFTDKDGPPKFAELPKDGPPTVPLFPKDDGPKVPMLSTPTPLPKDTMPPPPKFGETTPLTPPGPLPKIPPNDLSSTPPIALPGVGKPMPTITNTDPYVCQAGDTSFAVLSQKFYGNDKYADALLAYNRENYKLIKNGIAFLGATPVLLPGQHVEHPPLSVLERSYRNFIPQTNVSTIPTIPPSGPTVKISTPVPLNTGGTPTVPTTPAIVGKTYTVKSPGGESIFDVAERTLGNRNQWPEIWRVNQGNPAVRPPAPIPMGTELKLP